MTEAFAALEATALAQHLKASRWTYPLVNAGHVLGIALLVGAALPMNLRTLVHGRGPAADAAIAMLRPFAVAGLTLAVLCGVLLFMAQASDYAGNGWFRAKMTLLAAALANAAVHLRRPPGPAGAALSLILWPAVLVCGRMIGYS